MMGTKTDSKHSRWWTVAGLGLLVIVGAYLRFSGLDQRTVTHIEMFVPGIHLPPEISGPGERLTLAKTVTSTLSSDTHPIGYFVLMWAWTKCFGTSVTSIRIPSTLFAIASIPLIFWLGVLVRKKTAAGVAAILLTFNAHHIFWSQAARMFTLECFLGLLATVLLLLIAREERASWPLGFLYVLVLLMGVATHVFFWAILGTHMLWTFLNAWSQRQPLPGSARLQIFALVLGSPLLAFAAYQSANPLAVLSSNILIYAREFVQFAFLFPLHGFSSGVFPNVAHVSLVDDPHLSIARWLFFLLSLILLGLGVASIRKSEEKLFGDASGPSSKAWLFAAVLGTLAILAFILMAKAFVKPQPLPTLRGTEILIVLPFAFAGLAIALQKTWVRFSDWLHPLLGSRFLTGEQALVLAIALIPFAAMAVMAPLKPMFNARGILFLTPYPLLILAWGIARAGRNRFTAAFLLIVLSVAHYQGWKQYNQMQVARADYKGFAAALAPHIEKSDLVFLPPGWTSTPIFYYFNPSWNWNRFIGLNYEAACRQDPRARIWALVFYNYDDEYPKAMEEALSNYTAVQNIEAPGGRAVLYVPKSF